MGTTVSLLYPRERPQAILAVRGLFTAWEQALSRFRADSELSALNQSAGASVAVSPLLFDALATALDAAEATGGLYDPTLLRQITALGYDRSFELLGETVPTVSAPAMPGGAWRSIRLDAARRLVTLPAGAGVDLGGIAKGMAVDAALALLRAQALGPALLNAGGDLAVLGTPPGATAWSIAVPGPGSSSRGWTVPLERGALATSGIARRCWRQGEQERHHLIDPRSGQPAHSALWSVSAVAASCAQAEVAAKVAFVLGIEAGAEFLQAHGLAGLLLEQSGRYRTAGAWPVAAGDAGEMRP